MITANSVTILVHSAYVELKAGGEVRGLLRSNPKIKKDPLTKDAIYDMDIITADDTSAVMIRFSADVFIRAFILHSLNIGIGPHVIGSRNN